MNIKNNIMILDDEAVLVGNQHVHCTEEQLRELIFVTDQNGAKMEVALYRLNWTGSPLSKYLVVDDDLERYLNAGHSEDSPGAEKALAILDEFWWQMPREHQEIVDEMGRRRKTPQRG